MVPALMSEKVQKTLNEENLGKLACHCWLRVALNSIKILLFEITFYPAALNVFAKPCGGFFFNLPICLEAPLNRYISFPKRNGSLYPVQSGTKRGIWLRVGNGIGPFFFLAVMSLW